MRESRCGLPCFLDGSLDGLTRFNAGEGIAAGLHLFDADTSRWNVPHVRDTCGDTNVVLISWAQRARGFIVADEAASAVRDVTDLRGRRVVARNSEAGSQMHFDHITAQARVGHDEFDIVETVRTETDAALCILEGKADVAFGLKSLAALYKLCFVPVAEERYDLIIDRRAYFEEPLQTLFAFCGTATFHEKAAELAGYDVSGLGQVRWNGA
ncbi:MAG: substrate-binding domain-containing protein [Pseudomonadota bacterium]